MRRDPDTVAGSGLPEISGRDLQRFTLSSPDADFGGPVPARNDPRRPCPISRGSDADAVADADFRVSSRALRRGFERLGTDRLSGDDPWRCPDGVTLAEFRARRPARLAILRKRQAGTGKTEATGTIGYRKAPQHATSGAAAFDSCSGRRIQRRSRDASACDRGPSRSVDRRWLPRLGPGYFSLTVRPTPKPGGALSTRKRVCFYRFSSVWHAFAIKGTLSPTVPACLTQSFKPISRSESPSVNRCRGNGQTRRSRRERGL